MKQTIVEADIESLLNETSTDRKHLQVGLENQKVTLPEPESGLKVDYRIVHNIHKNPTTKKWQGFVNHRGNKLGVEYKPTGLWVLVG